MVPLDVYTIYYDTRCYYNRNIMIQLMTIASTSTVSDAYL